MTLAMEHNLADSRKRLEMNLTQKEQVNLVLVKFRLSYENKTRIMEGPLKEKTLNHINKRKSFWLEVIILAKNMDISRMNVPKIKKENRVRAKNKED